jgi:Type IV secretion-system coupling protein DNA-binding domain
MHASDPKFNFELKPNITYFGKVQTKSEVKTFGILDEDRRKHMYILGKTGMGKSTLLENLIIQDIYNDKGLCFIDPHGDSSEYIIKRIPERRLKDLVYFNPSDLEYPIGMNILEPTSGEDPYLVVSGLMQIFAHIWAGSWSSRMEYILSNTLFALLDVPGSTLLGVVRMLSDNDYKEYIVSQIKNPTVKNFWVKEYAAFNDKYRTEAVAPILNKVGQFFSSEITLNMMGQAVSTINFRTIMDDSKILIMNLSKGKVGESAIGLLGSMIITKLQLAAMGRVNIPEAQRRDFFLYVDEFQNFTTESFATILSEARKYRLCLTLAHQYIKQLEESDNEKVKNAVFGNVGTMMTFAIGAEDALKMEQEFEPIFTAQNLVNLSKHQLALKLGIQGKPSAPFLAQTMPPILPDEQTELQHAVDISRANFTVHVDKARAEISEWMTKEFGDAEKKNKKKSQFGHIMGLPNPERPQKDGDYQEGQESNQDNQEQRNFTPRNNYNNNNQSSNNRSNNNYNSNNNYSNNRNNDERPRRDDRGQNSYQNRDSRGFNNNNSNNNTNSRPERTYEKTDRNNNQNNNNQTTYKTTNPFATKNQNVNPQNNTPTNPKPASATPISPKTTEKPNESSKDKLAMLTSLKSKSSESASKTFEKLNSLKKIIKKDE